MLTLNDVIAFLFCVLGFGFLVFAYVWYLKTIKHYPVRDENIPLAAFNEMKDK